MLAWSRGDRGASGRQVAPQPHRMVRAQRALRGLAKRDDVVVTVWSGRAGKQEILRVVWPDVPALSGEGRLATLHAR